MKTDNLEKEIQAEYSVLGALLIDNDAIDRIADLLPEHFYNHENRQYFEELQKQIIAGKRADVITIFDSLRGKIPDCLQSLNMIANTVGSSANIQRYADIIIDKAIKRALVAIMREGEEVATSFKKSAECVDLVASKLEKLSQRRTEQEPQRLETLLGDYAQTLEDRMSGKIKPIKTGYADLDFKLGGGLERGTLTVVAGRPAMGKTAFGLGVARNVSFDGSALFLSMEMPKEQVCDRNIAALGQIPIQWLRNPSESPPTNNYWDQMTKAFGQTQEMNLFIDDQTALNMMSIRNKSRKVKRLSGLDLLVIDQLSFIAGATSEKLHEAIGEHTRGLLAIAKEMKIAVILLCQLNRDCEKRPDKRPLMSDLASSGSIEQDADNILFLYRDEVYNADSQDKGVCEVIIGKQRQGSPGFVGLKYFGEQTRFEDLAQGWQPSQPKSARRKGLAADL